MLLDRSGFDEWTLISYKRTVAQVDNKDLRSRAVPTAFPTVTDFPGHCRNYLSDSPLWKICPVLFNGCLVGGSVWSEILYFLSCSEPEPPVRWFHFSVSPDKCLVLVSPRKTVPLWTIDYGPCLFSWSRTEPILVRRSLAETMVILNFRTFTSSPFQPISISYSPNKFSLWGPKSKSSEIHHF